MMTADRARGALAGLTLALAGCATLQPGGGELDVAADELAERIKVLALSEQRRLPSGRRPEPVATAAAPATESLDRATVIRGDGNFINRQAASRPPIAAAGDGEVTLNFELADIRDVIKVVFDTLGENYILDPRVQGEVTVQTSAPLSRDLLIPTLETLLQSNGATLVRSEGVYRILPISEAVRGNLSPRLGGTRLPPGHGVRIFPLDFISAEEMRTILEPFAPDGGILLADPVRNLLILAGTSQELRALEETIDIFDVNWLKGMSVGLYVLENIESVDMAAELSRVLGPDSGLPFGGLFRFLPIERLNAILVITPQQQYLNEASAWIKRLDDSGGERLYVYEIQYSTADYLATLLSEVYGDTVNTSTATSTSSGRVAPGRQTSELSSGGGFGNNNTGDSGIGTRFGTQANVAVDGYHDGVFQALDEPAEPGAAGRPGAVGGGIGGVNDEVRIVADSENNSLLIWADAQSYDKILSSLRRIDVPKRQLLIEAMIAEVRLTDRLEYGLRWYFENSLGDGSGAGSLNGLTDGVGLVGGEGTTGVLGGDGFTYAFTNSAGFVRAALTLLARDNNVRVLSSPQLMVVDNQQASIVVGDQVPILTSSTLSDGGNQSSNFQFRDTGVILEVQPQINAGGLVTLDISQEVTNLSGDVLLGNGLTQPSFRQRRINSRVSVQSGETLVLGGLIQDEDENIEQGVPVLSKLPVVGALFGNKTRSFERSELVVLLTPTVVNNQTEASEITAELRERMRGVLPLESLWQKPALSGDEIGVPQTLEPEPPSAPQRPPAFAPEVLEPAPAAVPAPGAGEATQGGQVIILNPPRQN